MATGLLFRAWANAIIAPIIAFDLAIALASHGFGFFEGVLVTVACLIVSQVAYFVGLFLESRVGIADLADYVLDDQPGDNREHEIGGEQEKRRVHPSRSLWLRRDTFERCDKGRNHAPRRDKDILSVERHAVSLWDSEKLIIGHVPS